MSFKPNCYQFGSCHVQGHQDKQMVSFGNLLIISRSRPPKWPTGYHAGIVSDPRPPKNSPNAFSTISLGVVCFRNDPPFEMAFHSEWLRNNPKGPHGPIPPRAPKAPLGPLGPLDPLGSPGSPGFPGVSPRDRRLVEVTEGRLESLVAERIPPERMHWVGGMRFSVYGF